MRLLIIKKSLLISRRSRSTEFDLRSPSGINNHAKLHVHDKITFFFENVWWSLLLRRRRSKWHDMHVMCDCGHCEGTGNNFVKQSLANISERLLTTWTLLEDAADSKGVETAKNELELAAETEGTLSAIVKSVAITLVTTSLCLQENLTSL